MPSASQLAPRTGISTKTKWITFVALLLIAFYLLAVTPVRTYFAQQTEMKQQQQRYQILTDTNKQLQNRANQLQSDDEIKRLARERYELVEPGQQAFAVMPPAPTAAPAGPTGDAAVKKKHSVLERVWNFVDPWN